MIIGSHLIWTAYGWWLPNDTRGSSSHEIRVERIAELGELHHGRKVIQPLSAELRAFYDDARQLLRHELLTFSPAAIAVIAEAFAEVIASRKYTCYACAIMPDHVHALIRRHRDHGETMIEALQDGSRTRLIQASHRKPDHPVWGGPGWKRFLNTRADIERVVRYIRANPIKAGFPEQRWPFVTEYDGWVPRPAR
jgi:REP element-mobilizing transposase RayT